MPDLDDERYGIEISGPQVWTNHTIPERRPRDYGIVCKLHG